MALAHVPVQGGAAICLNRRQTLTITNPTGGQVCDFFCFSEDLEEHLSMAHCHTALTSIHVQEGDVLVSNRRQPMLRLLEDTSPGIHDTLIAACDRERYRQLGHPGHANCSDNLMAAISALGLECPFVPAPLNLWMNIPIAQDGRLGWEPCSAEPGSHVRFEALIDCVCAMSACPQDLVPINPEPSHLVYEVN